MGYVRKKTGIDLNPINIIEQVADFVLDEIIEPVMDFATDIVDAAMSDPIGTIAKIAAIATGQYYLLPYISVASVAIQGGDLGDIAKAAVIAYVAGEIGQGVADYAGTAGSAIEYGVDVGSQQATMLAIQEAGTGSVASIVNSLAAASFGQAAAAVVLNKDPIQAFISGGITAGVPAALGKIDGFKTLQKSNPTVANVIQRSITAELQGGDVSAAALNSLIVSSNIAAKAIKQFDPENKLTESEKALATNLIINTTTAAVKGGDISATIEQTLVSYAVSTLGKTVTKEFKEQAAKISSNFDEAVGTATKISSNEITRNDLVSKHNNIVNEFQVRSDEQNRLVAIDKANRDEYIRLQSSGASNETLNVQVAKINASTETVKNYANDFKNYAALNQPMLAAIKTDIDTLTENNGVLQNSLTLALEKQVTLSDPVSEVLDSSAKEFNKSFVEVFNPTFNAEEYRKINGLSPDEDPYTDWLQKGRDAGVPTNFESAKADIAKERTRIVTEALAAKGLTLDSAKPEYVGEILDSLDRSYGNSLVDLRAASIQDVISGNTKTFTELVESSKNANRVEISGSAYGEWKPPSDAAFKVPSGYKLASEAELQSKDAEAVLADDGNAVWLVPDGTGGRVVWNSDTESYELPPVVVTGIRPTTVDIYSVAATQDPENAGLFTTIAATAATGIGGQIETWANSYALQFGSDFNNTAANLGKSIKEWGETNTPADTLAEFKAVGKGLKEATSKGSVWDQTVAVAKLAKDNPNAFMAYLGSEVTQEALPIGAGFVAAGLAAFLGAPMVAGVAAAATVSTLIDAIEVFGSSGKEVYDARIKAGDSENEARSKASLAGYKSAIVTAPSNALANAAIFVPYLKTLGVVANTAMQGAKGVTASAAGEYIETYTQSLITQVAINPDAPLNYSDAHVKSVFASMIGAGTSGVILAPAMLDGSLVIGFDDSNNPVTYADLQSGSPKVNSEKIDASVVVGQDSSGENVTLGDLITSSPASEVGQTVTEYTGNATLPTQVESFIDPLVVDESEVRAVFDAIGYTPTQADINSYIGNKNEAITLEALDTKYNPLVTTVSEAQQMARDLGYTNLTNAEAQNLAGKIKEADAQKAIETYVGQHMVSADTVKQLFAEAGIKNPTAAQVAQFTKAGPTVNAEAVKAQLNTYADPLGVNEAEARATFKALGLSNPTDEDVQALMGTYSESLLSSKAISALKDAAINSKYKAEYDSLSDGQKILTENLISQGFTKAEAIGITKNNTSDQVSGITPEIREQYETLSAAQKAAADASIAQGNSIQAAIEAGQAVNAQQITDAETKLTTAIQAAKDAGMEGDAALQAAINSVAAEIGVTKDTLLSQLGTTEAALRQDFAVGISDLEAQTKAQYDALSTAQKATADALVAQGETFQEAIAAAQAGTTEQIAGVTAEMKAQYDAMTAAQKATADALVAQGETFQSALALAQTETSGQIAGLSADMQAKYDALSAEQKATADALVAQGKSTQEAIDAAQAKTTAQIAGVTAEMQAQYNSLNTAQKATADALVAQGETFQSALALAQATTAGQIGDLSAEMQSQYASLNAAQKATADALIEQGKSTQEAIATAQAQTTAQIDASSVQVNNRIDELVAQGKTYQQATEQAFAEVNQLIGTQGRNPNQSDIDALEQMIQGTRPVDTRYDANKDGQINDADIDFLTNLITNPNINEPYFAPTGLYGQLAQSEAVRAKDARDAEAARARDAENQRLAAEAAKTQAAKDARNAQLRSLGGAAAQQLQQFVGTAPQLIQQATQATSTPLYGQGIREFEFGSPLDFGYFEASKEKQGSQSGQQPTKMASGGYLEDLLAENMTADDLLKLLR